MCQTAHQELPFTSQKVNLVLKSFKGCYIVALNLMFRNFVTQPLRLSYGEIEFMSQKVLNSTNINPEECALNRLKISICF